MEACRTLVLLLEGMAAATFWTVGTDLRFMVICRVFSIYFGFT
jgi:hypothetical protein